MLNLLAVCFVLPLLLSSTSATDCECYRTSTGNYFTNYEFHDFRQQSGSLPPVPDLPDSLPRSGVNPNASDYSSDPKIGAFQDGFIKSDQFTNHWSIEDWGKDPTSDFPIRMQNSRSNVYLVSADSRNASSKLVMRTHRFDDFHSSAEMESIAQNILYASIRIHARVYGAAGAVADPIFQSAGCG
ncbi:hypothetical protein L873DRAFT_268725 [Choiromyces venosus 120613-1]|uniref:Uncharacterized protein n=1 Tax=Choiromyces venosus 120613-1 TaxID=1336337 RepID=A0A3N4J5T4_9PEZI|nr:hypothetical protein L873DRAFT_268725 [Choiromyces venosus 120613-1]